MLNLDGQYVYSITYVGQEKIALGNINGSVYIYNTSDKLKRALKIEGKLI